MMHVLPPQLVFGGDYTFYSSTSPALVDYHRAYAAKLQARYPHLGEKFVLEIACNDGSLLRHFNAARDAKGRVVGIDPAEGPVHKALEDGLDVWHETFTNEIAHAMRDEYGPADLILANHVTAHVTDLLDFLWGIKTMMSREGVAILEVQYLPDLLLGNQIDHVYHEHRSFFSLTSLTNAARFCGLEPVRVDLVEPQGGSMQVTLAHEHLFNQKIHENVDDLLLREAAIRTPLAYAGMQMRADRLRERLWWLLEQERQANRIVAGYGMPAKATTLLNFCGIDTDLVSWIEDTTPSKVGRFSPGTKIPIIAPGTREKPDTYLLSVWNYASSVLRREREFADNGGRFIVPIPAPVLL
jgi:ubiquinone/menaquinone biosynthesis C-methylase UbiE